MISQPDATRRAREFMMRHGAPEDVSFTVRSFDEGWLLMPRASGPPRFGGIRLVVDRETGEVVSYPTSVPPELTISEYRASKRLS